MEGYRGATPETDTRTLLTEQPHGENDIIVTAPRVDVKQVFS
jgi:hypothetical protein